MRKILFRGKRIDNGEWVHGNLNYGTIEIKSIKDSYYISDFDVNPWDKKFYPVIPESVGQYTGLTDKNGKKIFEGDIVRTHYANAPKAVFVETVIFDGGKFCSTSTNEGCKTTAALWDGVPRLAIDKSVYMDEVEVIGNIADNPELLEVKK